MKTEKIDKEIYVAMLEQLEAADPEPIDDAGDFDIECTDMNVRLSNLKYLKGHGLIRYKECSTIDGFDVVNIQITEKGQDYLREDGGLSAELNVVVIKLHADTIKSLIADKIKHAEIPPEQKQKYLDQLQQLPAESTKHLVNTLVEEGVKAGLQRGPQVIQWLSTLFQNL